MKAALLCVLIAGCAEQRYLTKEQDDTMREVCETRDGCAVIPANVYEGIKELLRKLRQMQGIES